MLKEEKILSLLRSRELEIDDEGRIWRIAKRQGGIRGPNGEYLKGSKVVRCKRVRAEYPDRSGYLLVAVQIGGKRVVASAHRIVWTHWHGPIPATITINHINGRKSDNRKSNLELATYSQQRRHALEVLNVARNQPKGSKNPKAQVTESEVIEIRRRRAAGEMVKDIALAYGMNPKAVSQICTRRTWKHI